MIELEERTRAAVAVPVDGAPLPLPPGPAVILPRRVVAQLVSFGLRTEPGRACWEGFLAGQLSAHPWLEAPLEELSIFPQDGAVTPRPALRPEPPADGPATGPNGRPGSPPTP